MCMHTGNRGARAAAAKRATERGSRYSLRVWRRACWWAVRFIARVSTCASGAGCASSRVVSEYRSAVKGVVVRVGGTRAGWPVLKTD